MPAPIIFDVGANNGFVSTQLAQLLKDEQPQIYAFEPVPSTFCQLVDSIERLRLDQSVTPICCALSDEAGICTIAYNPRESLFAQVRSDTNNVRAGNRIAIAPIITIDDLVSGMSKMPVLIKIDVEGSEPSVFRGAMRLLRSDEAPVLCFEWNPFTIGELNKASDQMTDALKNYQLFYIDDFEGQKRPFGAAVDDLTTINLVCNIFAVPKNASGQRWTQTLDYAFRRLTLSR
jgi:FkbM family methyltransferase